MKNYTYFVPTPATLEELKALYRKLAFTHHPDRGGTSGTMYSKGTDKLNEATA